MSDGIAAGQDASNILAYMKLMFDEAKNNGIRLKRSEFKKFGKDDQAVRWGHGMVRPRE